MCLLIHGSPYDTAWPLNQNNPTPRSSELKKTQLKPEHLEEMKKNCYAKQKTAYYVNMS